MSVDIDAVEFGISIHALRGEGDTIEEFENYTWQISIHALRGEGDAARAETLERLIDISIHALRGEGDFYKENSFNERQYFNPRPPWGGRQDCSG